MNIELFVRISPRTFPREVLQKFEESVEKKHIIRVCGWFSKNLSRVQITNSMSVHNIKINTKRLQEYHTRSYLCGCTLLR